MITELSVYTRTQKLFIYEKREIISYSLLFLHRLQHGGYADVVNLWNISPRKMSNYYDSYSSFTFFSREEILSGWNVEL